MKWPWDKPTATDQYGPPSFSMPEQSPEERKRQNMRDLLNVLKTTHLADYVNWDAFAKHAEKAGLHYDHRTGWLMKQDEWDVISKFLKPEDNPRS